MQTKTDAPIRQTSPLRYAIGMFGTSIPINMFKAFASAYYVDHKLGIKLTAEQYALIIAIYTFVDAIDNPIYGFLSDRTRTPWGRRRPWLIIGAPLLALAFIFFYNPPMFTNNSSLFVYVLLMYTLTGTLDSLINANYGALFPELFSGDALRSKTNAMRQAFQLVAMVISIALTPVITNAIGYSLTAIIYAALAVGVILFCAFGCRENPQAINQEKPSFLGALKDILVNKRFWMFGLTNAFYSAATSLVMQAVNFYVRYTLRLDAGNATLLLGTVLIIAIASVALWAALIRRYTLMPVWRIALILLGIAFIPMYFVTSLVGAILASTLVGLGMAGVMSTMDLIGARIMDEDTRKTGLRREGIYSSTMGFMNRLNGLFISLAFFLVTALYGFESGDNVGPNPGGAARFLMVIFPLALMAISCVFSLFLKFGDEPKAGKQV